MVFPTNESVPSRGSDGVPVTEPPPLFCWTKMGAEAGQGLDEIIQRKELERDAGEGYFAWGIGNALGRAITEAQGKLKDETLKVAFTPMRSVAQAVDQNPSVRVLWLNYETVTGVKRTLPEASLVTSRYDARKTNHYALLCYSETSIEAPSGPLPTFKSDALTNFRSANPVGSSQVTAVVQYHPAARVSMSPASPSYSASFTARLTRDGFVRLTDPVPLTGTLYELYLWVCEAPNPATWRSRMRELRQQARMLAQRGTVQPSLFTET